MPGVNELELFPRCGGGQQTGAEQGAPPPAVLGQAQHLTAFGVEQFAMGNAGKADPVQAVLLHQSLVLLELLGVGQAAGNTEISQGLLPDPAKPVEGLHMTERRARVLGR